MAFSFEIAGAQIDGARDYQEDAFLITRLDGQESGGSGSLVILADGMGGHAAGNVASNLAVQACNKHITARYPSSELPKVLRESIVAANKAIQDTVKETPALHGMGCTFIAAVLEQGCLYWASVR